MRNAAQTYRTASGMADCSGRSRRREISRRCCSVEGGGAAFYKALKVVKDIKVVKVVRDIRGFKGLTTLKSFREGFCGAHKKSAAPFGTTDAILHARVVILLLRR